MAATRPVAGQPIETAWGQQAHDVAVERLGVLFTGGASVGSSLGLNLSFAAGHAGIVDVANKWLLIPVTGLWRINCEFLASGGAATGAGLYRVDMAADGGLICGASWGTFGGVGTKSMLETCRMFTAGQKITFGSQTTQGGGTPLYTIAQGTLSLEAQALV